MKLTNRLWKPTLKLAVPICTCLFLSGCPSASNPTTPQTSSTSNSGASSSSSSSEGGQEETENASADSGESTAAQSPNPSGVSGDQTGAPQSETSDDSGKPEGADESGMQDTTGTDSETGETGDPGFSDGTSDSPPAMRDDEPSFDEVLGAIEETGGSYRDNPEAARSTGGTGPLTPAEQVAILDAQLEKGTGDFDAMILEEQEAQRRATREQAAAASSQPQPEQAGGNRPYDVGMNDGGGMGGASSREAGARQNTAKYPPPADIPDGNDDDVVARQLREAAMREPDPAVREKLWDEYRKYKGITK